MKHPERTGLLACFVILLLLAGSAGADGGVLIPNGFGATLPPNALELAHMEVRVEIDNGMADVAVLQIYKSRHHRPLEGEYVFMIPETAELYRFAIWEDGLRIPGVIMQRHRARRIYEELRAQMVDPGLMESGDEENVNRFSCRVFPIPAFGTKRIELTYTQVLPVESEKLYFYFPSKPTQHEAQRAGRFAFHLSFNSDAPFGEPVFSGDALVPEIVSRTPTGFVARLNLTDALLTQNVEVEIPAPIEKPAVHFLTYRDVDRVWRDISAAGGENYRDANGFFSARVVFPRLDEATFEPKQVVFALDTSLSMQWDKLDRALATLTHLLTRLGPEDRFGVVLFNTRPQAMTSSVKPSGPEAAGEAEQWIRSQSIAGGTDFTTLFDAIAAQFDDSKKRRVVLLTDGAPTLGQIDTSRILQGYEAGRLAKAGARLFVVGVGDDANRTLLSDLAARGGGPYTWIASTENHEHKAAVLADRLDAHLLEKVSLELTGTRTVDLYPKNSPIAFGGGSLDFVGRFGEPGKGRAIVRYELAGAPHTLETPVAFPVTATDHEGIRRRWAKARVMDLLDRINREGEREEWVSEVVALSKQFTFVTPYTSFLAAPRALLRPRVIRPGDPILRVKTDPSIRQVIAAFPFGLTEKMRYLPDAKVWQLRFLAPPGWPDGSYECVLYLTDAEGRRFVETKRFVIDGRPPRIFPRIDSAWRAGTAVEVVAAADRDTRRLSARIPYAGFCELRYDPARIASVGTVELPASMPVGTYTIQWFAEDFAHNVTRTTSRVEVVGHE